MAFRKEVPATDRVEALSPVGAQPVEFRTVFHVGHNPAVVGIRPSPQCCSVDFRRGDIAAVMLLEKRALPSQLVKIGCVLSTHVIRPQAVPDHDHHVVRFSTQRGRLQAADQQSHQQELFEIPPRPVFNSVGLHVALKSSLSRGRGVHFIGQAIAAQAL